MKKLLLAVISIVMCLCLLTGCDMLAGGGLEGAGPGDDGASNSPLEQIEAQYGKIAEASKIEQHIQISSETLLQYESQRTYTKSGSGYSIQGKEKRLNALSEKAEGAYTEEAISETVTAGEFQARLKLDALYFTAEPVFTDGGKTMEATVLDRSVEAVFGLSAALPKETSPHDLKLKLQTDGTHLIEMQIGYTSKTSTVTIELKFTY